MLKHIYWMSGDRFVELQGLAIREEFGRSRPEPRNGAMGFGVKRRRIRRILGDDGKIEVVVE